MSDSSSTGCPLCSASGAVEFHRDRHRSYLKCPRCSLVYVPPAFHLSDQEEKKIYDLHENDPYDEGYRRFLSRVSIPLTARLKRGARGLDFGCGPGPALIRVLEEQGFIMSAYDKFYAHDPGVLERSYDFICATELVEHLRHPSMEFDLLFSRLKSGGILAVMTKMVIDQEAFSRWHYIQDPTHICFYSRRTFEYLSRRYDCSLNFVDRDVLFFQDGRA